MIYDSTVGAFVPPDLFSGGATPPAIAPIGTESKQPDFFRTKGDGPSRVAEVRSSNMRRMLSTAQVPAERAGLLADETRLKAARAADFARWQSLGSPGDFDTWVGEKYAAETGRKSPGSATRTLRTINAGMSGTDSKDYSLSSDFNQYGALVLPQMATNVASQLLGGKDREARALERYAMMRSKTPEPLGAVGTMKAVGKMASTKEGLLTLARGMVDPDNMLMNAAALVPVAGLVGKGAGALAKGAEAASKAAVVAENAPRLASGLKAAQRAGSLAEKASSGTIANIAADAALGGSLNALQQDQNTWDDFQAGALPGAVMGLGSSALGKVGSRIGDRIAKTADAGVRQVKLHPIQDQINLLRKEKGTLESPLPNEALTAEDLHPIATKFLGSHKIAPENRTAVQQFVKDYGHLFVPDIAKFGGDIGHETQVVTKALDDMTKTKAGDGTPGSSSVVRKGKQYTQTDVDQALSNYIPLSVGPDQIPEFLAAGKKGLLKTHYDLKRMKEQGLTPTGGGEIPIHPELDNVNALTQQVEAARAKKQSELDKKIADAATDAERSRLQEERRLNDENAKAQKDELEREGKIKELSVKSRLAARGEDVIPGSLNAYLGKLKPEELGLIMDDELVGGGRFEDLMPVMADKLGPEFDELKNLRLATQGNEKLWAEGAKTLLGHSQARLDASNSAAQKVLDSANESQAIREGVASTDEAAATADANAEMARKRAEEKSATDEEQFLKASDDEAEAAFQDVISKYPERAELLGISKSNVAAANNPDSHFNKGAKARIQAQIKDAVRVARERGLPKGFF